MRLDRVDIGGFMNFREPAVLDLRDIAPGLVAITGANGNGKTRLLDAGLGAAYGFFPSRDGNMADYATERNAYVDAIFTFEGRGTYRTRYNVDGQTNNRDAVLELIQPDGTPVALNDGKVTTHRDAIGEVFPPKELVLASAFAAQNRAGSFVSLGKKERKDLFGSLLGLDHYARMAETAKTCMDVFEATRARLAERRDMLLRETGDPIADALQQRGNRLQSEGGQAELRRGELQDQLEALAVEREELAEQAQAYLVALEVIKTHEAAIAVLRAEKDRLTADRQNAATAATTERTRADIQRSTALTELDARERTLVKETVDRLAELDERIQGNQTLNAKADEIRAAAAAKVEATSQLADLREKEGRNRDDVDLARDQVRVREEQLAPIRLAANNLERARRQVETLSAVPCGGAGEYAVCQFLTDARKAHSDIPVLESQTAQIETLKAGIALWQDKVNENGERLKGTLIAISQVTQRLVITEALAKYEPELKATEARIEGYESQKVQVVNDRANRLADLIAQRESVERRHRETHADIDDRFAARCDEIGARQTAALEASSLAHSASTAAEAEADRTQPASIRLAAIDLDMDTARNAWTKNESELATVQVLRAGLQREWAAFTDKRQELDGVIGRLREAENQLLLWQLYVKAFGRDGLPTLEIAAAGPTVSNLTNDLLTACFGTRFTVELVTQEERADKKGLKECFELKVFDNEHGGDARDIADLSGGERVIVDEALRAALALYVNSRNQAPIRTCWRDETTGALDPENATRYVAMLRRLLELGGFAHILFITHNEDAAALADTRIVVTNGQPEVRGGLRRAA